MVAIGLRRRTKLRMAVAALAGLMVLAGCSVFGGQSTTSASTPGSKSAAKKVRVAVLMSNAGDPYFSNKSYGYAQYAKLDPNLDVKYYNAGGYNHLDVQLRQIEDAVTSGYGVILLTAVDTKGVCPAVKGALDKNVVVVADDTGLDCSFKVPLFITENSFMVGFTQCKFIADRQNGKGGIAAIWGPAGPAHIHRRQLGCEAALKQYPNVTLLSGQFSQTSGIDDGLKLTEDFITRFGHQIGGIYSAGAVLAAGAAKALQGAGFKPGDVTLVGIDMTSESVKAMSDGWLQGIQPSQPIRLAYATMEYGAAMARGDKNIPGGEGVLPCCQRVIFTTDYMVVTPDLFQTFPTDFALAPTGWKPPV